MADTKIIFRDNFVAPLKWLSMNALASNLTFSAVQYLLFLLTARNLKHALLQRSLINLSSLSIAIPSNFILLEQGIIIPLIFSLKGAVLMTPTMISLLYLPSWH